MGVRVPPGRLAVGAQVLAAASPALTRGVRVQVPRALLAGGKQGCGVTAAWPPPNRPGVGSNPTAPAGRTRRTCSRAASTSACQAGEAGAIPARCFGEVNDAPVL